jgi:lysozyme
LRPIPLACLPLVHQFEGTVANRFEATRTLDPTGHAELGWGHKLNGSEDPLWNATLTESQADDLAMKDLAGAAMSVCEALGPGPTDTLTDNQYAALIDFTYNAGAGHFISSTLCRLVKAGDLTAAADEFARWVYSEGVSLPGLIRRRAAEKALWLT